jgi:hypothetical protein
VNPATTDAVQALLRTFMRRWLEEVPDPSGRELEGLVAPFHDALVPGCHVNRRTGWRAGGYVESIIVARA